MLHLELEQRLRDALQTVLPGADTSAILVRPSPEARFGDYQCNALMGVAKERKLNPRQLAADVVAALRVDDIAGPVEIAGPGFLNFRLKPEALGRVMGAAAAGDHLFFTQPATPRTVVIDFSAPNVAKPMHVGHIRSTVLGNALSRILRFLGHRVVTDNHIGDWGTQFGMLLVGWKTLMDRAALDRDPIGELERIYKEINSRCKADPTVLDAARSELVLLQQGNKENLGIWHEMIRLSQAQFDNIYSRLRVSFDHTLGESFYNPWLADVVAQLRERGVARASDGAVAVFSEGAFPDPAARPAPKDDPFLIQRDGEWQPNPALIQKSDGGYNYATTDLATLDYRCRTWAPDEIIYVTDGRQQLHFRQLFATFKAWQPAAAARIRLTHAWFGSILGEDGKPFKTRSGDTVKLAELLDEAEQRALDLATELRPELPEAQRREIARIVGLGAVKYQDLLPNRQSDYVFSWEKMLALRGNTAPYVQYQYTRAAKVLRDAGSVSLEDARNVMTLTEPAEITLARHLLNFGLSLQGSADECRPNYLCNYLFELAGFYSRFYEACPVLKAAEPHRMTRLALCHLTARVLRQGLDCLGIEVSEVM